MAPSIRIDSADGSVQLPDLSLVIRQGMSQASLETMLFGLRKEAVDYGNGYSWESFNGLTLGKMP
jgi:hypothetical protein